GGLSEHRLLSRAPGGNPEDPTSGPDGRGDDEVGALLGKPCPELAAYELGDGCLGGKVGGAGGMPARDSSGRDAATGNEAMHVGVVMELLGPGMENSQYSWGAADEAGVAGNIDDGMRCGLHQEGIAVLLVGAQNVAELLRDCDGDVKVGTGQHLELAGLEPALGIIGMTLGAAAIAAAVVGENLLGAVIALPEVSSQRCGATGQNVGDGAAMRWQQSRTMGRQVGVRETAEDVGDLDHEGVRGRS